MPDNSEQRQKGTDDHAGDSGDLHLGHALYARHAHFPGVSSAGSQIVRRIARFNAGASSLGRSLYRRWAGSAGGGFSWPDMEWLQAYRGDQASKSSSPQRTPFSGGASPSANRQTATTPILRSTEGALAPINAAASSKNAAPLDGRSLNQSSLNQPSLIQPSLAQKGGAFLARASDSEISPPIVAAHAEPRNPPLMAEASTPAVRGERKIESHKSVERQQGKQPFKAHANESSSTHSAPVHLGRAILQRSTERGRSDAKPNVSGPPAAVGALPASINLNQRTPQLSSEAEPTKSVNARETIEKSTSAKSQHGDQRSQSRADQSSTAPISADPPDPSGTHVAALTTHTAPTPVPVLRSIARSSIVQRESAARSHQGAEGPHFTESSTRHVVHPEVGKSFPEPSLGMPRGDAKTEAIQTAEQSTIADRQSSEKQASQLALSGQSSNVVSQLADLPRKQEIMRAILQRPAPGVAAVHLAPAKNTDQSENGLTKNVPTSPASAPGVPIGSDARRQGLPLPAASADLHTTPSGEPASPTLNVTPNRPSTVFRALAPSSGTPFIPAAQNSGAHLLQRHLESRIMRVADAGMGLTPDSVVVQPVSDAARPQPLIGAAGDIPAHSGSERAGTAPGISAQPVIQDSAMPRVERDVSVVREETGTLDGAPTRTHRMSKDSDSHGATSPAPAALPTHHETAGGTPVVPPDSGAANPSIPGAGSAGMVLRVHDKEAASGRLNSNEIEKKNSPTGQMLAAPDVRGKPQAATRHLDRSAIRGQSALEQALRTHSVADGDTNARSVTISRSRQEARTVCLIHPAAGLATLQEHDSLSGGAPAGSSFLASVVGAPERASSDNGLSHHAASVPNLVHRSSTGSGQAGVDSLRPPAMGLFRSVSLTHRAAQGTDGLQRSPWSGASMSHVLSRQSSGAPPTPSAIPATVPLPTASSSTYQAGNASQTSKSVDIGQLANRVYDLLVRRLASERQRRGL